MTAVWNPGETVRLIRECTEVLHNANEEAMSDTPRSDAAICVTPETCRHPQPDFMVDLEFARALERQNAELLAALKAMTAHYVALVDSGDAGNWNANEEVEVKSARAAIAKAESK